MLGLGDVHGHIGVLKEVVHVDAVVGRDHVPDARLDRQRETAHLDLVLDDVAQPAKHLFGVAYLGQDEPELVPAQACHGVLGPRVVGEALGQQGQELVAALVAQGVVDLLEPVQVDDGDGSTRVAPHGSQHRLLGALVEQRAVGQLGERVVLGQELVLLDLLAQAAADRDRDEEQHEVQGPQAQGEVAVQRVQAGAHVLGDGRVGQVHLEHAHDVLGGSRREGQVDLDGLRAQRQAGVVAVGVEVRELGGDLAVGSPDGLVVDLLGESRPVVGVDDVARHGLQAQAEDVVVAHRPFDQAAHGDPLGRTEPLAEGPPVEERLDGRLRHDLRLGPAFGHAALPGVVAVAGPEGHAEQDHRHGRDRRVGDEQPRQ